MGQTLERLFEQKVLNMPKEVSSTFTIWFCTVCIQLCPLPFVWFLCVLDGIACMYVAHPSWEAMLTQWNIWQPHSSQQVLFNSLIPLTRLCLVQVYMWHCVCSAIILHNVEQRFPCLRMSNLDKVLTVTCYVASMPSPFLLVNMYLNKETCSNTHSPLIMCCLWSLYTPMSVAYRVYDAPTR